MFQLALNAITTFICFSVGNWEPCVSRWIVQKFQLRVSPINQNWKKS